MSYKSYMLLFMTHRWGAKLECITLLYQNLRIVRDIWIEYNSSSSSRNSRLSLIFATDLRINLYPKMHACYQNLHTYRPFYLPARYWGASSIIFSCFIHRFLYLRHRKLKLYQPNIKFNTDRENSIQISCVLQATFVIWNIRCTGFLWWESNISLIVRTCEVLSTFPSLH